MSLNSAVRYKVFNESVKALRQDALKDSFLANGDGPWAVIYDEWSIKGRASGSQFITLFQLNMRERVMRDVGRSIRKDEGIPGFVDNRIEVSYLKSGSPPEFEPLVTVQNFFGVIPDRPNISEDFRLLIRLWPNPKSRNYCEIQESGDEELTIRTSGEKIEVRTRLLKGYLATRQLDAVLYTDSNMGIDYNGDLADLTDFEEEALSFESFTCFSRDVRRNRSQSSRTWTRPLAKRILKAPPREKCGIWPWDEIRLSEYPEFIVSENESAEAVSWAYSPKSPCNYYDKSPSAPHHYTPVYFKPEILERCYKDNGCEVRDGYLSCENQWGVNTDNGCLSYASVSLGDIDCDIPQSHWNHWKAYNIVPIGDMSEEATRCSSFDQSTKNRNPEHTSKRVYATLQEEWEKRWGWRLYRRAEGFDVGVPTRLYIPVNGSEAEFRVQPLNLASVLVGLLNEKRLTQGMDRADNEKGIDKLSRLLESNEHEYVECDISLLREVQLMRSHSAVYPSGTRGRVCLEEELGGRSYREYLIDVIDQTAQMPLDLRRPAASHASVSGSQEQVIKYRALGTAIDSDGETDNGLSVGAARGAPQTVS